MHKPLALLSLVASLAACRGDATPPLYTASEAPNVADAPPTPPPVPEPHRSLWFADGPGRDAILARERQDFAAAAAHLDRLLASSDLSADDRAAAQWLRGLEDLRLQQYAAAAARFAEARAAAVFAPVGDRLRLLEAQAWLDGGEPGKALAAVGNLSEGTDTTALVGAALIVTADARARTADGAGAGALYDRYLQKFPEAPRRHEVRAKWARLLVTSDDPEQLKKGLALYERLALDTPLSAFGEEATERIPALEQRLEIRRSFAESRDADRKRTLARLRDALARSRYTTVIHDADEFLRLTSLADVDRCEALFLKGSAIFKQRKRSKARPVFDSAAAACRRAGKPGEDNLVKALYQSGRGRYADAAYETAAKQFEAIAVEFPAHSYADDALILAGESWAEEGDHPRERLAYERVLKDIPAGDMTGEARRRLILLAFTQDRVADALALADAGLTAGKGDLRERAKLHYFRGRAFQRQGQTDAAVAAWLDALAAAPLSYAGLQTLSRLRDIDAAAFARGVAVLEKEHAAAAVQLELPGTPAARRAQLLARLGLGEQAEEELDEAGVAGWPAIAVLAQAGLYSESQKLLGALGSAWREDPPVGQRRVLWSLAHPLAFESIVRDGESSHQVPSLLTFAIMQTESRFDPGATSWAGARGLVQLMPATAKDLARQAGLADFDPDNLYQPSLNLDLGTRYLGNLVRRYGGADSAVPLAIPSYNAGAGAVDRWLDRRKAWDFDMFIEAIPFDETRAYTQSVLERWLAYRWVHGGDVPPEQRIPYIPLAIPGRAGAERG
ncbi:MAG: transglycosylase SLT domain-containing protein [Myxococcales bacterium]|nr:transglycosylase SLT domain-containing protein [Myxococcales bacterium]